MHPHIKSETCLGCATPDLAFAPHDHGRCEGEGIERAEVLTGKRGVRLTPVRRRVLQILLKEHKALGAYDVLNRLAGEGFGNQPPVAYRALEFLEEQGLVHRIRRLNAYVACLHPGEVHAPAFLICRSCNAVAEAATDTTIAALSSAAGHLGFRIERATIEAIGLCPVCQPDEVLP